MPDSDPTTSIQTSISQTDLTEAETLRFTSGKVGIIPLSSGAWAIYGHASTLTILPELDPDQIRKLSQAAQEYGTRQKALYISTKEAQFYGEPDDRTFIRDIRRANTPKPRPKKTILGESFEDLALDL